MNNLNTLDRALRSESSGLLGFPEISRGALDTLQVNLGYRCNQACAHCHVDAGPSRTEEMTRETIEVVLAFAARHQIKMVDVTGGAPELNPNFRYLVTALTQAGTGVIDRCNLTILEEPGQDDLAIFLATHGVSITASMPCYTEANVDLQRGKGVFEKSIRGLIRLNEVGYAIPNSGLELDLVYNPTGPFLPPPQRELEETYREELRSTYGIEFTRLLTLANMPIARFRHSLLRDGVLDEYLDLLVGAYRAANLDAVMCRNLISVDWRGFVYDCDFNQMLEIPLGAHPDRTHLSDLLEMSLTGQSIAVADHCFGCTAGQGSSCGGALKA